MSIRRSAMNKWVTLVSLIAANLVQEPAPVVHTSEGLVRGRLSENGRFYQYYGIPYGMVDNTNRFQAPLPPLKWKGILEAINENIRCPQRMVGNMVMGKVDCLELNIYTPVNARPEQPLPVMVYIHGGCFVEGTGAGFLYGGDNFADYGVVFVGINYRLNVEGFLCLGIKEAPGNAGLKDQIAALKWIKKNIRNFGGDPDNVTLFGESAGAVSTSLLILAPGAKGLFHKAILQSGSTLVPWGLQHDPIQMASNLAKEFGYVTKDPRKLYSILSKKSPEELILAIKYPEHKKYVTAETLFSPCIEKQFNGIQAVISSHPANIIKSGNYNKIPMIIGYNDKEGIYFVAKDFGTSVKSENIDTNELIQPDLEFPSAEERRCTVEKIRQRYFPNETEEQVSNLVDLYSDLHVKFPVALEAELYSQTNNQPIFYYLFKYSGLINIPKLVSRFGFMSGASHADELFYLFKPHSMPLPFNVLENTMTKRMLSLWTNFAKFSDPTPQTTPLIPIKWRPSRKANPMALVIDEELSIEPLWEENTVTFWNDTYNKYRRTRYGFQ